MQKANKWLLLVLFVVVCFILVTVYKPAAASLFFDPHGTYETSTAGCGACHFSHYSTGSPLLTATGKKLLCYSCHDGSGSIFNVKEEFGEVNVGSSVYESYHPVSTGVLTCTNCHNPHLTPSEVPGLVSVGESGVSSGIAVCGECHGVNSTLEWGDMIAPFTGTPHDTKLPGPQSGTGITCIRCHQPHGSPYGALLQDEIHDENLVFTSVTGNNNTVCFGCHTSGMGNYKGKSIFTPAKHGSSVISNKAASVYPGTSYLPGMCLNCHEPHGRTGNSFYTRDSGNDLCVSCHDIPPYPPQEYSYRGIAAYNNTPHAETTGPTGARTLYRADSQDFTVWEWLQGQTPNNPGLLVEPGRIASLFERNSSYLRTELATLQGDYNTQMYMFKLTEPIERVNKLKIKWIGYGEPTLEHPTELSFWNITLNGGLGGWDLVSSQQLGTEGVVEIPKDNAQDYINAEKEVYLLAGAKHDGTSPVNSNIQGEFIAPTTYRVTWQTNEPTRSWIEYGVTTDYGTTVSNATLRTSQSLDLTGLQYYVVYHYRIRTEDALGNVSVSEDRTFELCDPPPAVTIINFINNSVNATTNPYNVTFQWNAVAAGTLNRSNIQYKVEVSTSPQFTSIYKSSNWLHVDTVNWTTSVAHNTYYWRVKTRYNNYPDVEVKSATGYVDVFSCPVLYTWDGEKYTFVTDIVGGSFGLEVAPGRYSTLIPGNQLVIPGEKLVEKDGFYSLKIKNELDEIDYLDNLVLQVVDHPAGTNIALNDFMRKIEPLQIYTFSKDVRPVKKATYFNNPTFTGGEPTEPVDITELVSIVDNRHAIGSMGDDHHFTFDLGDVNGAETVKLVITGWNEFANLRERQERMDKAKEGVKAAKGLLEVLQPDGSWVSEEVSYIPGHTKTMVLDLSGKFPENTEEYIVRLRGIYRPHLDFVGIDTTPQASIETRDLHLKEATLEYKGSVEKTLYPSPYYDYYNVRDIIIQHEGRFTRFGDVLPLLAEIDDKLVVMDTGDELSVTFEALPPPAPGMTRSYVLKPWVYYKETSTATVDPMPYRGMDMSKYPAIGYPEELLEYVEEWNTRIHPTAETEKTEEPQSVTSAETVKGFFARLVNWFRDLLQLIFRSSDGKEALVDQAVDSGQLHYSLNTNYLELEVESSLPPGGVGYCSNCHAVHGNSNAPKQLKNPVNDTCFGNGFGCHSDPLNSANGSMSASNFTSVTGAVSRHSIDPKEQAALGTKVGCLNCHNPHVNNADVKTVDPFDTTALLDSWVDNGITNYLGEDGSVYLMAKAQHDGIPPVISNINHTVSYDVYQAAVTWTTNEVTTRELEYIITPKDYAGTVPDDVYNEVIYLTNNSPQFHSSPHQITITGLQPDLDYRYRIRAEDRLGNWAYSSDPTYDKLLRLAHTPSAPTNLRSSVPAANTVRFEWDPYVDPDGYPVQYYVQVTIYDTFTKTTSTINSSWINQPSWDATVNETPTKQISWKVKATNVYGGESPYSVTQTFNYGYSCPVLYTWNGDQYTFVTDIVGGSFGLEVAPGKYATLIPGNQLVIPGENLVEKDGIYSLKIKNELDEIDYFDNLVLQVVDHPQGTKIALNDFLRKQEPQKIYTFSEDVRAVKNATYFNNPTFSGGEPTEPVDITDLVSIVDNRHAIGPMGDDHHFTFDLGEIQSTDSIKLVIVGWNEFANLAEREERLEKARQGTKSARGLLEVLQPDGTWTSEEISYIPGHTKTMVIDLSGKFAQGTEDYIVRLRGIYRPHLDFVGVDTTPQAAIQLTDLQPSEATLEYKGIVEKVLHPSPYYDYYKPLDLTIQHEGRFTRFGDVLPLLQEIDDKLVVMDTGDELSVTFKALPAPEPGMTRSYVLKPWVYYKETHTATVEPMPFRGMDMSTYPDLDYPEELWDYIEEWNTRIHTVDSQAVREKTWLDRLVEFIEKIFRRIMNLFGRSSSDSAAIVQMEEKSYDFLERSAEDDLSLHYSLNTNSAKVWVGTVTGNTEYIPVSVWESDFLPDLGSPGNLIGATAPWSTDLVEANYAVNYQVFKFSVLEQVNSIQNLSAKWIGYGEPTPGYNTYVSIWNFTTGDWEQIKAGHYFAPTTVDFFVNKENTAYCNKCHDNVPPSDVRMGSTPPANIAVSVTNDYHGNRVGTKATLKAPYGIGNGRLACDDCHDPHGNNNTYHLRETINSQSGISITNVNGQGAKPVCQACHTGDILNNWHSSCKSCHGDGVAEEHGTVYPLNETILANCFSCHGHSRQYVFPANPDCSGCHAYAPNADYHNYIYQRAF